MSDVFNIDEYQAWTNTTWVSVTPVADLAHAFTGLSEEAGEVAGVWKRAIRGDGATHFVCDKDKLNKELGDLCYYIAQCAEQNGLKLSDILRGNVAKLEARKAAGTIKGSGDER